MRFSKFLTRFKKARGRSRFNYVDWLRAEFFDATGFYPSAGDVISFIDAYQKLSWSFRGINLIASSAGTVQVYVYNEESGERITDHSLVKLLKNPNKLMTRYKLFETTVSYLELVGCAYWFLETDYDGVPVSIHLPRPDKVTVIPKKDGSREYRRTINGKQEVWNEDKVVPFSYFNPLSQFYGMSPLLPISESLLIDLYSIRMLKTIALEGAKPPHYLYSEMLLPEEEVRRIKAEWREKYSGWRNIGETPFLHGGVELKDTPSVSAREVGAADVEEITRERILGALGVFPSLLGIGKINASVLEAEYRMFWEITMVPKLINIQEAIDKYLLSKYKDSEKLEFTFDFESISALQPSYAEQSVADFRYMQTGALTANDVRKMRRFGPPKPWGDLPPKTALIGAAIARFEDNEARQMFEGEHLLREKDFRKIAELVAEYLSSGEYKSD